jgi:hypothetical protein
MWGNRGEGLVSSECNWLPHEIFMRFHGMPELTCRRRKFPAGQEGGGQNVATAGISWEGCLSLPGRQDGKLSCDCCSGAGALRVERQLKALRLGFQLEKFQPGRLFPP